MSTRVLPYSYRSAATMKSTHVFSHLLTSTSIYSLNFFGHSPSEFPQKYTQSSSGSTSCRSAKLTENNVNFIKGKSCHLSTSRENDVTQLYQGKIMSINYIKGKYDTSLNYIKGKLLASQSAAISRKPKILNITLRFRVKHKVSCTFSTREKHLQ